MVTSIALTGVRTKKEGDASAALSRTSLAGRRPGSRQEARGAAGKAYSVLLAPYAP